MLNSMSKRSVHDAEEPPAKRARQMLREGFILRYTLALMHARVCACTRTHAHDES